MTRNVLKVTSAFLLAARGRTGEKSRAATGSLGAESGKSASKNRGWQ